MSCWNSYSVVMKLHHLIGSIIHCFVCLLCLFDSSVGRVERHYLVHRSWFDSWRWLKPFSSLKALAWVFEIFVKRNLHRRVNSMSSSSCSSLCSLPLKCRKRRQLIYLNHPTPGCVLLKISSCCRKNLHHWVQCTLYFCVFLSASYVRRVDSLYIWKHWACSPNIYHGKLYC